MSFREEQKIEYQLVSHRAILAGNALRIYGQGMDS